MKTVYEDSVYLIIWAHPESKTVFLIGDRLDKFPKIHIGKHLKNMHSFLFTVNVTITM